MSSEQFFKVNINAVVFATDIPNNKKYILSTKDTDLEFPHLILDIDKLSSLNSVLVNYLKQYVFVSDLELLPQIINLHSSDIKNEDQTPTLNVIYGFIVNYTNSINNCYWIEFDYLKPIQYSNLIFEVIQKLK
jgi:hypothetical protein